MVARDVLQDKFRIFILLSLFVLLMEVAGGIFTNSLALLSDAGHVFIDLLALLLAYISMGISKKAATKTFTFGYYRTETFSAIINGIVLIFITLFIFYESYTRFLSPQPVKGPEMLAIAAIGFLANLYVVIRMQKYETDNLNVRGAYLHVLSDTLSSVGVIIAAVLVIFTGNYIFDPIVSAMIGLFILVNSLQLLRESMRILMEAAPKNMDLEKLSGDILKTKGVKEVHDLHVWAISSDIYALSSHILIDAKSTKSMNRIISRINDTLKTKYNITHTVLQTECERCAEGKKKHEH